MEIGSEDEVIDYAIAVAEGIAESPDYVDDERMDEVATFLATRTFTRFVQEEDVADEEGDDRLLRYITNAIAAAYCMGVFDAPNPTQPNSETFSVSGKSGSNLTININVS